jgi:hypothetical protein
MALVFVAIVFSISVPPEMSLRCSLTVKFTSLHRSSLAVLSIACTHSLSVFSKSSLGRISFLRRLDIVLIVPGFILISTNHDRDVIIKCVQRGYVTC